MNIIRAIEILNSPNNIEVLYKGEPIWINSVDSTTLTANVRFIDNNKNMDVNVKDLNETGNIS